MPTINQRFVKQGRKSYGNQTKDSGTESKPPKEVFVPVVRTSTPKEPTLL